MCRLASASVSETSTASPGVSRRVSPAPAGRVSRILAPDSTATHSYDTSSELASALGLNAKPYGHLGYPYDDAYPDALPFASVDALASKRCREY